MQYVPLRGPGEFRGFAKRSLPAIAAVLFFLGCGPKAELQSPEEPLALPDFGEIQNVVERKKRFFAYLRPLVESRNGEILKDRKKLLRLHEKHGRKKLIQLVEMKWLEGLLEEYGVEGLAVGAVTRWEYLLRRVDVVPVDLALVQAAKESGWGTSRFAREGNNLFGQRCFTEGCGIVPEDRPAGARYEVKKFASATESVRGYIHNLNTNGAYGNFRRLRYLQRLAGKKPNGYSLVEGLPRYSERRIVYLDEIRAMILANRHLLGV